MTDVTYKWKRGTALKPGDMVRASSNTHDCFMVYKVLKGFAGEGLILFKMGAALLTDQQQGFQVCV